MLKFFKKYKVIKPTTKQTKTDAAKSKINDFNKIDDNDTYKQAYNNYVPDIELMINNQRVTSDLQAAIKHESTKEDYLNYLSRKKNWEHQQTEYIDWESLSKATNRLTSSQQTFVTKYIHGWLPTSGHPGFESFRYLSKTCPQCKDTTESNQHFILCKWNREENTTKLIEEINKNENQNKHTTDTDISHYTGIKR
jgi:hypothetical protein